MLPILAEVAPRCHPRFGGSGSRPRARSAVGPERGGGAVAV